VDNTAHDGHAAAAARRSPHATLGSRRRDARRARPGTPGNPKTMSYLQTRPLGSRLSPEIPQTSDFGRHGPAYAATRPESETTTARLKLKNPSIRCGIPLSSNAFGVELTNHNQGENCSLAGPEGVRIRLPFTVNCVRVRALRSPLAASRDLSRSLPRSRWSNRSLWPNKGSASPPADVSSACLGKARRHTGVWGHQPTGLRTEFPGYRFERAR
jgi:hypothetical protein